MKSNIRCGQQTPPARTVMELRLTHSRANLIYITSDNATRHPSLPRMIGINKPIVRTGKYARHKEKYNGRNRYKVWLYLT